MANVLKTEYMNRPTLGYSEYLIKSENDLSSIPNPHLGDRAIAVEDGKIFVWIDGESWSEIKVNGGGD